MADSQPLYERTVNQIVSGAFRVAGVLGVGQTLLAQDFQEGCDQLNDMIQEWYAQTWLVYRLEDYALTSTGALFYTVGPQGDFNIPMRPDVIAAAFMRQLVQSSPNQLDFPLTKLNSREDYNRISVKNLQSFSGWFWYDPVYPLGELHPWPVPNPDIYALHLSIKQPLLPGVLTVGSTEPVILPPIYYSAIRWNLGQRLRASYGRKEEPRVNKFAKTSLDAIRIGNTAIPELAIPTPLLRPGIYNPYADEVR